MSKILSEFPGKKKSWDAINRRRSSEKIAAQTALWREEQELTPRKQIKGRESEETGASKRNSEQHERSARAVLAHFAKSRRLCFSITE
jgi:hypothetical protein